MWGVDVQLLLALVVAKLAVIAIAQDARTTDADDITTEVDLNPYYFCQSEPTLTGFQCRVEEDKVFHEDCPLYSVCDKFKKKCIKTFSPPAEMDVDKYILKENVLKLLVQDAYLRCLVPWNYTVLIFKNAGSNIEDRLFAKVATSSHNISDQAYTRLIFLCGSFRQTNISPENWYWEGPCWLNDGKKDRVSFYHEGCPSYGKEYRDTTKCYCENRYWGKSTCETIPMVGPYSDRRHNFTADKMFGDQPNDID